MTHEAGRTLQSSNYCLQLLPARQHTCVLQQNLVHVSAGVLVQLVARAEDDQRDLAVAQHRQLVSLLHHAKLPFVECDLDSKIHDN